MCEEEVESRAGETLKGKYRLDELLGVGGMGEVYRAYNVMVDRTVAIKLLRTEFATNAHVVERFMREAKASNAVHHRNIVDVLDIDQDETGTLFIVEEYLEGEEFAMRLSDAGGPMPPEDVIEVVLPVAEAVGVAHEKGVVHRDLKPENIFLAIDGGDIVPKVLDFGISKIPLHGAADDAKLAVGSKKPANFRLTAVHGAVGTPTYMSPEQIKDSSSVDARSDVWSIGVILYEALAGHLPFDSDTLGGLFAEICTREPPQLHTVVPDVPGHLARVVHRCLQPDPKARYASATELAAALSDSLKRLHGESVPAPGAQAGDVLVIDAGAAAASHEKDGDPSSWELELPVWSLPPDSQQGSVGTSSMPPARRPPPVPAGSGDSAFGLFEDDTVPSLELDLEDDAAGPSAPPAAPQEPGSKAARWSVPPSTERELTKRSTPPPGTLRDVGSDPPPSQPVMTVQPKIVARPAVVGSVRPRASRFKPPTDSARGSAVPPGARTSTPAKPVPAFVPTDKVSSKPPASAPPTSQPPSSQRSLAPDSAPSVPAAGPISSQPPSSQRSLAPGGAVAAAVDSMQSSLRPGRKRRVSVAAAPVETAKPLGKDDVVHVGVVIGLTLLVALLAPAVSPTGLVTVLGLLGTWSMVLLTFAALGLLAAGIWAAIHGIRWVYFSLLLSTLGLVMLSYSCLVAGTVLGAPGWIGGIMRMLALITAPWTAVATFVGFGIYAVLRAQQLRKRKGGLARKLAIAFYVSAGLCVVAILSVLVGPVPGISDVAGLSAVGTEVKTQDAVRRFTVITVGARRLDGQTPPDKAGTAAEVGPTTALAGGKPKR